MATPTEQQLQSLTRSEQIKLIELLARLPNAPVVVLDQWDTERPYYGSGSVIGWSIRDLVRQISANHKDATLQTAAETNAVSALAKSKDVHARVSEEVKELRDLDSRRQRAARKTKGEAKRDANDELSMDDKIASKKFTLGDKAIIDVWAAFERMRDLERLLVAVHRFIYARVSQLDYRGPEMYKTADDFAAEALERVWQNLVNFEANLPQEMAKHPARTSGECFLRYLSVTAKNAVRRGGKTLRALQSGRQTFEVQGGEDIHSGEDLGIIENPEIFHSGWSVPLARVLPNCEQKPDDERFKHVKRYKSGREQLNRLNRLAEDKTDREIIRLLLQSTEEMVETYDNNELDSTVLAYIDDPDASQWVTRQRTLTQEQIAGRLGISTRAVRKRLAKMKARYEKISEEKGDLVPTSQGHGLVSVEG